MFKGRQAVPGRAIFYFWSTILSGTRHLNELYSYSGFMFRRHAAGKNRCNRQRKKYAVWSLDRSTLANSICCAIHLPLGEIYLMQRNTQLRRWIFFPHFSWISPDVSKPNGREWPYRVLVKDREREKERKMNSAFVIQNKIQDPSNFVAGKCHLPTPNGIDVVRMVAVSA